MFPQTSNCKAEMFLLSQSHSRPSSIPRNLKKINFKSDTRVNPLSKKYIKTLLQIGSLVDIALHLVTRGQRGLKPLESERLVLGSVSFWDYCERIFTHALKFRHITVITWLHDQFQKGCVDIEDNKFETLILIQQFFRSSVKLVVEHHRICV